MASKAQPTKTQKLARSERRMFSASDDSAMMKQIQATHAPDGRDVDAKPILQIIDDLLHHATPGIERVINGVPGLGDSLEGKMSMPGFDGILESFAYIIPKVPCKVY